MLWNVFGGYDIVKSDVTYPMYLSEKTKKDLGVKFNEIDKLRPIRPSVMKKIQDQFQIEMTYNSNAIEGNSLTLKETFWVVNEGLTIKEKPLKDHLEAKNHNEALEFLYELIDQDKQNTFSENLIKQLHKLVVRDSNRDIAGSYRDGNVLIGGSDHKPPSGFKVKSEMRELIRWFDELKLESRHPVELAALLHHKLVYVHPFWDGNGRTARLVMNLIIMSYGYPLGVILKNDRKRYYRVLSQADQGHYKPLCEFVAQAVLRSMSIYLKILVTDGTDREEFLSLKELSEFTDYSVDYLRKLALSGKLEAHKEGRDWLSSRQALQRYVESLE